VRVAALVDGMRPRLPDQLGAEVDAMRAGLDQPLRVAVVGRLKAGKSTLVNAILGQRVAPTDVSECTRMVTLFSFGHPQRVEVVLRDGGRRDVQLDAEGRVPETVGVAPGNVARLQVWLTNETLRSMTLIDTPGLASLDTERSAVTEDLLAAERDSSTAEAAADAVVLVLNQSPRADELEALETFQSHSGGPLRNSVNAIGVLTKADQAGGGGAGAWEAARRLATRQADRFRNEVAAVVPVVGLIAETAEAALLTETEAAHVASLAGLAPDRLAGMLLSADRFVNADAPLPGPARRRLLDLLGLFGVERAVSLVAGGVQGAFSLRGELSRISGIEAVRQTLWVTFRRRSDALKAWQGLAVLDALSYRVDAGPARELRDAIERLRLDPGMHELAELGALQSVRSGEVNLPPELSDDVERLVTADGLTERLGADSGDAPDLRAAATRGASRWRTFTQTGADPRQAQLARTMIRSYSLAFQQIEEGATT
jgi:predicted GTPase